MAYVTLKEGAFNDESVIGRTVRVEMIEILENPAEVSFGFTWPENPYDTDTVGSRYCQTATEDEVRQAAKDYANEGRRFNRED